MTMNYARTAKDAKGSCSVKVQSQNSPRGNVEVVRKESGEPRIKLRTFWRGSRPSLNGDIKGTDIPRTTDSITATIRVYFIAHSCMYMWNEYLYFMHSVSYIKTSDTKAKSINIPTKKKKNASICDIHALCWKLRSAAINCVAGVLVKQFVISRGLWRHAKFTLLPKQQRQGACAAFHVYRWNRMSPSVSGRLQEGGRLAAI